MSWFGPDGQTDHQVDHLRRRFPKVTDPRTLCLPGGMTRDDYIKFFRVLAEAVRETG